MPQGPKGSKGPRHLTYSDYINDRAIVESLRLPPRPDGLEPAAWPEPPAGWKPGDRWPTPAPWAHEEVLFIRTHQAFETWFALVIHELDAVPTIVALVGRGRGFSILPLPAFAEALEAGEVSVARIGAGALSRTLCLARNPTQVVTHASIVVEDFTVRIMAGLIASGQWRATLVTDSD
jgi:DNA-binding transcriptional LysR family regulator